MPLVRFRGEPRWTRLNRGLATYLVKRVQLYDFIGKSL